MNWIHRLILDDMKYEKVRTEALKDAANHVRKCTGMVDSTSFQGQTLRASLFTVAKEIEEL